MTDLTDQKIPLLLRLELAVLRRLAYDDQRYGEGPWTFRVENGTYHVAMPPSGTHDATMAKLAPLLKQDLGGGHLDECLVDPSDPGDPGGPRRTSFVIEGAAPADAGKEGAPVVRYYWLGEDGRYTVSDATTGQRYPVPAGPVNIPPPPPPIVGEGTGEG